MLSHFQGFIELNTDQADSISGIFKYVKLIRFEKLNYFFNYYLYIEA